MPSFSSGKHAKAISDRSGMEFPYREMRKEWNGMFVHKSEYEIKHPQLETRAHTADAQALRNSRSARTEPTVAILLGPEPFSTISAGSGYVNVYEKGHGRSTGDTVRFRGPILRYLDGSYQNIKNFDGIADAGKEDGYAITVGKRSSSGSVSETADYYYFTSGTDQATVGGISGGGENCSSGPLDLES